MSEAAFRFLTFGGVLAKNQLSTARLQLGEFWTASVAAPVPQTSFRSLSVTRAEAGPECAGRRPEDRQEEQWNSEGIL